MVFLSYAKINIGLWILEQRDDGYHEIATVFQQIDLHDKITYRKTKSPISITTNEPSLPLNEDNLVYQAFKLFQDRLSIREGLEIYIKKNIPIGGGLGGGSSNAAITLLASSHLWNKRLSETELRKIAARIGSDVPFFLLGGTALGQGRGEILTPVKWSTDYWIVLICPDIRVSTSWAYSQAKITLTKKEKITKFKAIIENYTPNTLRKVLKNDFEGVVFQRHPILKELKKELYKRDAFYASMSGSGSSVYGLFEYRNQADAARMFFSTSMGMKTFICRPISSEKTV